MGTTAKTGRVVRDLMTHDLVMLETHETVGAARDLMLVGSINSVVICDENSRAVGILTSHDLVDDWDAETHLEEVMSHPVTAIDLDASIVEAADVMRANLIHHLVVNEGRIAVGLISSFDLLEALAISWQEN